MAKRRMRRIVVVPYDPAWPQMFRAEAKILSPIFGPELIELHHIGSTAIVGMHAKPIIDFLPEVRAIEAIDALNGAMIELGYDPRGENGIPGRRYFVKGDDIVRTHHVHVFQSGHPDVARHVDFCAYLNAHPHAADRYSRLKQQLAAEHPTSIEDYLAGKTPLIREIDDKAGIWRREADG